MKKIKELINRKNQHYWMTESYEWKWFVTPMMQRFLEKHWDKEEHIARQKLEISLEKSRIANREKRLREVPHIILLEQLGEKAGQDAALKFLDIYIRRETAVRKAIDTANKEKIELFFKLSDIEIPEESILNAKCLSLAGKAHKGSLRESARIYLKNMENISPDTELIMDHFMINFDDLAKLDDRSMQRLLRQVSNRVMARALLAAGEKTREKVFNNLSRLNAEMMKEDMEYLQPRKEADIIASQDNIIDTLFSLENLGDIVIPTWREEMFC